MSAAPGRGMQWLLDFEDCACPASLLADAAALEAACSALVAGSGLQAVGRTFHQFSPPGVTGVVLLSESHLAIHTWPESRFAAIDLYVCNHTTENGEKGERLCARLLETFRPARPRIQRLDRGASPGPAPTRR